MPISKELVENGRVMRILVSDPWSFREMNDLLKQVHAALDPLPNKVHLLFDLRAAKRIPMDMMAAAQRPDVGHPKTDKLIFLGAGFTTKMMIGTLARMQRAENVHFFDREADAAAFVSQLIRA